MIPIASEVLSSKTRETTNTTATRARNPKKVMWCACAQRPGKTGGRSAALSLRGLGLFCVYRWILLIYCAHEVPVLSEIEAASLTVCYLSVASPNQFGDECCKQRRNHGVRMANAASGEKLRRTSVSQVGFG